MSAQNVALLRMAGRLVDVSGRSGQTHFEDQIRGVWASALVNIPRYLATHQELAERFAQQLAIAASKPQHATLLFALLDEGGKDTIVGEFFQNAEIDQLAQLGATNPDILRLLARVSGGDDSPEPETVAAPLIEFGLASVAVPAGDPAAGSAVVTETHVFPCAWEGPDSPGMLRDLVRIHEALTRNGMRKPLERYGQPQIELWLASEPNGKGAASAASQAAVSAVPQADATSGPVPTAAAAVPAPVQTPPVAKAPVPPPAPVAPPAAPASLPPALPVAKAAPVAPKPASAAIPAASSATKKPAPLAEKPSQVTSYEADAPEGEGNPTAIIAAVAAAVVLALAGGVYMLTGSSTKTASPQRAAAPAQQSNARESSTAPAKRAPAADRAISDPIELAKPSPTGAPNAGVTTAGKQSTGTPASAQATPPPVPDPAVSLAPAAPSAVPTPRAAETDDRRAAALDALGLPANSAEAEAEQKRRNALKALTGQ